MLAKKTRKIGVGKWIGWGGSVEEGETIRQAAKREFEEETGLAVDSNNLEHVGRVMFHNTKSDGKKFDVDVHMFLLRKWDGNLKQSPEMADPTFWPISDLPFDKMMASDRDWLPAVLAGQWIDGEVWYDMGQNTLNQPTVIQKVEKLGRVD